MCHRSSNSSQRCPAHHGDKPRGWSSSDARRPLVPLGSGPDGELDQAITTNLIAIFHDALHRYATRLLTLRVSPLANPLRGQGQVLALLKQSDGLTTKEMAQLLGIRTASLNELLVKLEAKGLLTRARSPQDGRMTVVNLTEAGRAVEQAPFADEMRSFLGEMSTFYNGLSSDEKKSLASMLRRIDEAMQHAPRDAQDDARNDGETADRRDAQCMEMWGALAKLFSAMGADSSRDA